MKNKIVEANVSLVVARILGGLNVNALKFLLPVWLAPFSGVALRVGFATLLFWLVSWAAGDCGRALSWRDRGTLLLLGALCMFGYMSFYLLGVSLTTPVNCAIFSSMQPIWVFVLSAIFLSERVTLSKVVGIAVGFAAALLCILLQPADHTSSSTPLLGNLCNLFSSIFFAVYLVVSSQLLRRLSNLTVLRYCFLGAALPAFVVVAIAGFDAPLFSAPLHWAPVGVLLFVLLFPTFVSYLLIPIGLKYLSTTLVSIYGYLTLAVATVVSLVTGQDKFSWWMVAAIALMCVSVYWMELAEKRK